jgi:hypothetical protein
MTGWLCTRSKDAGWEKCIGCIEGLAQPVAVISVESFVVFRCWKTKKFICNFCRQEIRCAGRTRIKFVRFSIKDVRYFEMSRIMGN